MTNFLYTLAFIKRANKILMVNRQKNPWQGMWNGVGGKRIANESPLQCIVREIAEETGITVEPSEVHFKGICTWNDQFKANSNGLYIFLLELSSDYDFMTPKVTPEGILDWKDIDWIASYENLGVAYNIPYFIDKVLHDSKCHHYDCKFNGNILEAVKESEIACLGL